MFTQQLTLDSIEALLPYGYTSRGASINDLDDAVALFNACSRFFYGKDEFNAIDYRLEWEAPGLDLSDAVRLVFAPDGLLVGCMEFWDLTEPHVRFNTWGRVHPEHTDRGIGTYLIRWAEERAQQALLRAPEGARVTLMNWVNDVDLRTPPLFEVCGWNLIRKSYRMEIELIEPPAEPVWPDGIRLRTFVPDQDERITVEADRDSFRDHWGYVERPFEDELKMFKHFMSKHDFDPTLWLLAMDGDRVAGICLNQPSAQDDPDMGWVGSLGVRREYRRRGLGLAFLQYSFADFYRRGRHQVGLGVDASSLTGALRLYEHAGMHVARVNSTFEKELRAGKDLSTQSLDK
jgi:ribosomal protein S18 acetylase RimI-like enzyme